MEYRKATKKMLDIYGVGKFINDLLPDLDEYKQEKEIKKTQNGPQLIKNIMAHIQNVHNIINIPLAKNYKQHMDYLVHVALSRQNKKEKEKEQTQSQSQSGGDPTIDISDITTKLQNIQKVHAMINKFAYTPYDTIKTTPLDQLDPKAVIPVYNIKISDLNTSSIYDKMITNMQITDTKINYTKIDNQPREDNENRSRIYDKINLLLGNIANKTEEGDIYNELLIGDDLELINDENITKQVQYKPPEMVHSGGQQSYDAQLVRNIFDTNDKIEEFTNEFTYHIIGYDVRLKNKWCEEYYDILFKILRGEIIVHAILNNEVIKNMNTIKNEHKKNNKLMIANLEKLNEKIQNNEVVSMDISSNKYCFNIITLFYYFSEQKLESV